MNITKNVRRNILAARKVSLQKSMLEELSDRPVILQAFIKNALRTDDIRRLPRTRQVASAACCLFAALIFMSPLKKAHAEPLPQSTEAPVVVFHTVETPSKWEISDEERLLVIRAVAGTAGNYSRQLPQMAVAQCIRDDCLTSGNPVESVLRLYRYHLSDESPSDSLIEAVDAVINGASVSPEHLLYCCNAAHPTQFHNERSQVAVYGDLAFYN